MNRACIHRDAASLLLPAAVLAQTCETSAPVKRGEYLVTIGLCHDCHTPLVMGPDGPEPDMKRGLSGHPQDIVIRAPANRAGALGGRHVADPDGLVGPWGVSFTANLTPDPETGVLRDFTEEQFIQTLRTGRHQGQGGRSCRRCPGRLIGQMTDEDLKAIFAYLRQIPPVRNKVPDPIPPAQ